MDSFEDLKEIWSTEKVTDLPTFAELQTTISAAKNQHRRKLWRSIAAVILLFFAMLLILIFSAAQMFSSWLGGALMLAAIVILLTSRINSLRRAVRRENVSNQEFIVNLKRDIERLTNDWNTVQKAGFACLAVGYPLFLYESLYRNRTALIVGYALTLSALAAAWIFLRPFANRQKLAKKEQFLSKIENLEQQIKE